MRTVQKSLILCLIIFAFNVIHISAQAPYYHWSSPFLPNTSSGSDNYSVNDGAGNVYSIGTFNGTVDFDPGPGSLNITSTAAKDMFLTKLDPMGNLIWIRTFNGGGTSQCIGRSIALSPGGNIVFTSTISGTVDLDPGPGSLVFTGGGSAICKFDPNGNLIWAKQIDGPTGAFNQPNSVTVDLQGNVYTTGYFGGSGNTDFDPGSGTINHNTSGAADFDGFLLKLDSVGTYKWVKIFVGSGASCVGNSVAVDPTGTWVYTTGQFQSTHDFNPSGGSFNLNASGNFDVFVARYQCTSGTFGWAKRLGGTQRDIGTGITVDGSGNPIITGHFQGSASGMFAVNAGAGFYGVYVAKINSIGTGTSIWVKSLTSDVEVSSPQVCRDNSNNIYLSGLFYGTVDFDPNAGIFNLTNPGSLPQSFITKWDNNSNFIWAGHIISLQSEIHSLSCNNSGGVYASGGVAGTTDFDPGPSQALLGSPVNSFCAYVVKWGDCITPTINSQPANIEICESSNTSFSINASGTGLTYQWQVDAGGGFVNLTNAPPYSNVTTSTLNISNAQFGMNGYLYRCVASGTCGSPINSNSATLLINPTFNTAKSASICNGDSYVLGSQTLTTAGTYTETFASIEGCDSIVTLTLTVNPTYNIPVSATICNGDSYTLGSQTLTSAGTYNETFASINGCDSIVTLTLTVNPTYNIPISTSICNGDSYVLGSQTLNSSGTYTETFASINGCDSIVTLTLTVNPTYNIPVSASICNGDSYILGSQTLTSAGTYNETFASINGCDSIVTLTLTVNPTYNIPVSASICNGDSYILGSQTLTSAGTYNETFASINGCDSIVTLTLTVNPTYNIPVSTSICNGDSYILGSQTLNFSGTYNETFASINGCDSIVTLTLTVNPTYNIPVSASICNGGSYILGSQTLNSSGTYTETFASINGCDSIVTLTLTVNPTYNIPVSTSICNGDSYILGSQTLNSSGTYTETFASINGCDSIVTITLTVNPTYNIPVSASICNGGSYILGSQTLNSSGTYTETFASINGCDSIVTLTLTVNPTYNIPVSTSICNGDSYILGSQTLNSSGTYNETFASLNGCDSIVTLTLTVNPTYNIPVSASICNGDSYVLGSQTLTSVGTYTETFSSISGCDSTIVLTLSVNSVNTGVNQNGNILNALAIGAVYQWINCNGNMAIVGETSQIFTASTNGDYAVVITENLCTDTSACFTISNLDIVESNENKILIYPNPTDGYLNITGIDLIENISITDISGRVILFEICSGSKNILLDITSLKCGVYVVDVTSNKKSFKTKIIKK